MIEDVKRCLVLRCKFSSRVVKVTQHRFRWLWIALIPFFQLLAVRLLKVLCNKEDANSERDEAEVNEIE